MKVSPSLAISSFVLLLSSALPSAYAATVDYSAMSSETTASPFDSGGIKVTSPGTLAFDNQYGLGVLGGITAEGIDIIDGTESARFTFDAGPATSVSFYRYIAYVPYSNSNFTIAAFGVGGVSLGTQQVDLGANYYFDITGLFGGGPVSSFILEGDGPNLGGLDVESISFTPAPPSATPEPSSLVLLGTGILGMAGAARRRVRAL